MADGADDDEGLQIVLTPVQLAALLRQGTLDRASTLGNRFWGALDVIGGAVEMAASLPLWAAPEFSSKFVAGAMDYAGADTLWTGARQVWTGRRTITLAAEAVDRALRSLGVDPVMADRLASGTQTAMGMAATIAAPLSVAQSLRAARVASIERGLIDLEVEEGFPGAHTIARHVGKSVDELKARLAADPDLRKVSTFRTLQDAEKGVSEVIEARYAEIQDWATRMPEGSTRAFALPGTSIRGLLVTRAGAVQEASGVRIVLRRITAFDRAYYVLTAYVQ